MRHDGQILNKLLEDRDLSVKDFSNLMGVDRQTVYGYFKSKRFSENIEKRISKVLEVDFKSISSDFSNQEILTLKDQIKKLEKELEEAKKREEWFQSMIDKLTDK